MTNKKLLRQYASKMGDRATTTDAEREIMDIVQTVSRNLSRMPKFKFGYHERADIENEAFVFALEVLELDPPKYDPSRPLEGFLYTHIRRRLTNFKRDTYIRSERPCKCCNPFDPPASPCERFESWQVRNMRKQNVMLPLDVSSVADEFESNMRTESVVEEEASMKEVLALIDDGLSVDLRADYLKMKGGIPVPKARRLKVREAIMKIIKTEGEDGESEA